ncbi:histone deacetylase 4-like isoform X4, partial [Silurus asotus]
MDVHHCHTTPKIFYKDPNILHISLHCYGNATPGATPMSGAGRLDEVDLGDGNGFNVNVEWSCDLDPPIGDAEYLAAFRTVIRPIARQFSPEIILISTEFNTAEGFGLLTQSLMELSGGHVVLVLERGHDHPAVCEASAACVNALLQNKVETLSEYVLIKKPCAAAVQSLHRVLQIH